MRVHFDPFLWVLGEIIVARAKNAHLILTFHEKTSLAICGILVSTNYRVTFVPDKEVIAKVMISSHKFPFGLGNTLRVTTCEVAYLDSRKRHYKKLRAFFFEL